MICDLDGTSAGQDLHLELLIVNFALKQTLMKTPAFHDVPWQLCTPAAWENPMQFNLFWEFSTIIGR